MSMPNPVQQQNGSAHAVNENVTISTLPEGAAFYKRLLKDYPG